MQKRIIVNSSAIETRIALVEGTALAELHLESGDDRSVVGHVFKGKVLRVLPGMQAAFVDIGLDKAAFMHVSDFWHAPASEAEAETGGAEADHGLQVEVELDPSLAGYVDELDQEEASGEIAPPEIEIFSSAPEVLDETPEAPDLSRELPEEGASTEAPVPAAVGAEGARPQPVLPPIEEVLSKGQEILVQVSKEPIGSKGARITSHISLPGRFVVYMPTTNHIGVSRRIEDEAERRRLRDIVVSGRPKESGGFIVRTACEGVSKREIVADMRFLDRLWGNIVRKNSAAPAPALLHEDLDIVLRSIRDLFTTDVSKVVVDRPSDYQRVIDFVDAVLQPKLKSRVELYESLEPIFDHFGVENQVQRALERRVWLKSGGYLVFDQTEALTTIDVNTGRFVGKKTHEETVLRTNLEAARVAVDQLRLRNIGGIIIIDFIDMEKPANRKKVSDALAEAVKRDKARTNILRISELGLVQMTRKRTRDNLRQLITSPCPTCAGDGRLRSLESLVAQVMRDLRRRVAASGERTPMILQVSSEVGDALGRRFRAALREFAEQLGIPEPEVRSDPRLGRSQWEIQSATDAPAATPLLSEEPAPVEPAATRS